MVQQTGTQTASTLFEVAMMVIIQILNYIGGTFQLKLLLIVYNYFRTMYKKKQ